jgi:hypothetical protein
MLNRARSLLLLCCVLVNWPSLVQPQSQGGDCRSCSVVERALRDLQSVKIGMNRRELEKYFVVAGGMTFRDHTSYVYRDCEYLKVDVDFELDAQSGNRFSPEDKISAMSQIVAVYPAKD